MNIDNKYLKYKNFWLLIGYLLVAFVVYQTLTSSPMNADINISDKYMHTVGYFVLMGWFVQIFRSKQQRFLCAVFFVSMGIIMEFLQDFGGVRFYEVNDMLANGLGVIIAWGLSNTIFSDSILLFEKHVLKVS